MKPVKGRITSSKPISLSKAARVLAQFVATDATLPLSSSSSQAVSAYLRRASASFDELIQFHRDLKSSKSHGVDGSNTKQIPTEDAVYNGGSPSAAAAAAAPKGHGVVGGMKSKRKKGKEMREERDNVDVVNSNHIKYESSERKKREKVVVEDDLDEQNDSSRRKKKKKKRRED